jgi:hypothetical protein
MWLLATTLESCWNIIVTFFLTTLNSELCGYTVNIGLQSVTDSLQETVMWHFVTTLYIL